MFTPTPKLAGDIAAKIRTSSDDKVEAKVNLGAAVGGMLGFTLAGPPGGVIGAKVGASLGARAGEQNRASGRAEEVKVPRIPIVSARQFNAPSRPARRADADLPRAIGEHILNVASALSAERGEAVDIVASGTLDPEFVRVLSHDLGVRGLGARMSRDLVTELGAWVDSAKEESAAEGFHRVGDRIQFRFVEERASGVEADRAVAVDLFSEDAMSSSGTAETEAVHEQ